MRDDHAFSGAAPSSPIPTPMTFPGRSSARGLHIGFVGFFVVMILVSWSVALMMPGWAGAWLIAVIGTATFGLMLGLTFQSLAMTTSTVRVDSRGLTVEGSRNSRSLTWGEIESSEITDRRNDTLELRIRNGKPLVLILSLLEDGRELGRIIEGVVASRPVTTVAMEETIVCRPSQLGLMIVMMGLLAAMWIGLVVVTAGVPARPGAVFHPAVVNGTMVVLYFLLIVDRLTSYVRLDGNKLTVGSVYRKREILLSSIEKVEPSDTGSGLKLMVSGKPVRISGSQTNFNALKTRLMLLDAATPVPLLAQPARGALVAPAPSLSFEPHVYGAKTFAWAGPAFMAVAFLAMGSGGLVMVFTEPDLGAKAVGIFCMLLFGSFGVASTAYAVLSRTSYAIDREGIERRTPFGAKRLTWREIDGAWRKGSEMGSYLLRAGAQKLEVDTTFTQEGKELLAAIDAQVEPIRSKEVATVAGRAFGTEPGMKAFIGGFGLVIGALMVGGGIYFFGGGASRPGHPEDALPSQVMGLLSVGCGLLMFGLAAGAFARRYIPHAHSLEARTLRGSRTVLYDDLRRVELGTQVQPKSRTVLRTMTLEHPEGSIRIDSNVADFGLLMDFIVAHVDPAIVRDERPKGG